MDPAAGRAEQISARTAAVIKTKKNVITYDDLQLDLRITGEIPVGGRSAGSNSNGEGNTDSSN
jgi:hypothetical protein